MNLIDPLDPNHRELPRQSVLERLWRGILGRPRNPLDPSLGKELSLVAFLAWVGLGVDGLSSSAYGPEEAYRALGTHTSLAVFLALATALTVCIISITYSKLIEHFPHGGGGYVVASQLLGRKAGVVSGSALLVDYVLTITVSIASGGDAIFSLLPEHANLKLPLECAAIVFLIVMNLRGIKESVQAVLPFFVLFLVTHAILIFGGLATHASALPDLVKSTHQGLGAGVSDIGRWGMFLLFLRAYSMGGGTYTGIEAVSNGVGTLREPRVATGKRTMLYLALSLAITAGGLLTCYMLFKVVPEDNVTLNATLAKAFAGEWKIAGLPVGSWFVSLTLFSESILLLVAAQTGFIDGPRVMANMAVDSWLPRRFSNLSDRLTMQNGILLMGAASMVILVVTRGRIGVLVVMYSINVFVTFSMSQLAMIKYWLTTGKKEKGPVSHLVLHGVGLLMCFSILVVMVFEKFAEGAWATIVLTSLGVGICAGIRSHYRDIGKRLVQLGEQLDRIPITGLSGCTREGFQTGSKVPAFDSGRPTAVLLLGGNNAISKRSLISVLKLFPQTFHNFVFLSVGVINSEFFKEDNDPNQLERQTKAAQIEAARLAESLGYPSQSKFRIATDVVDAISQLCVETAGEIPHSVFFAGELIFDKPHWYDHLLHNATPYAVQRAIRYAGLPLVVIPISLSNPHLETLSEKS